MSWGDLEKVVTTIRSGQGKEFTLVIGAGIHHMGAEEIPKDTYGGLACWSELLRVLAGENQRRSSDLTLLWELLALTNESGSLPAYKREQILRKEMQKEILKAEKFAKQDARLRMKDLREVVRSGLVSDVICLNMDLVFEYAVFEPKEWLGKVKEGRDGLRRRREFRIDGGKMVRVWHPHGDRDSINSLQMGVWGYQKNLHQIRKDFNRIKAAEHNRKSKNPKPIKLKSGSWLNLVLSRPLLFAGTGLSSDEWDIWYAMLMRWRNQVRSRKEEDRLWWLCKQENQVVSVLPELDKRFKKLPGLKWEDAWHSLTEVFQKERSQKRH